MAKMFHPNVREGYQHVSIDLLNSWTPSRTIKDIILGIIEIMINPTTVGVYGKEA